MKSALTIAATFTFLALGGCADKPEVDQLAQAKMIGLSKKAIHACLGAPLKKSGVGATEIWTYANGRTEVEVGLFSLGVNGVASGIAGDRLCQVKVIMTHARVTQVAYAGPDGAPLALGELCNFPVRNCVAP
jgi:hypothetical protein